MRMSTIGKLKSMDSESRPEKKRRNKEGIQKGEFLNKDELLYKLSLCEKRIEDNKRKEIEELHKK